MLLCDFCNEEISDPAGGMTIAAAIGQIQGPVPGPPTGQQLRLDLHRECAATFAAQAKAIKGKRPALPK
jgi:hypothetical protein